jgi:F1F0 ATPase subunit 2
MNELLQFSASFTAGVLLGLAFFWGLWLTVSRLGQARHPALWMMTSLLLRFGLVIAGFYLLARYAGWQHVLTAGLGFTLPRILIAHRVRPRHLNKEQDA